MTIKTHRLTIFLLVRAGLGRVENLAKQAGNIQRIVIQRSIQLAKQTDNHKIRI